MIHHDQWSAEVCNQRHTSVWRMFVVVLLMLAALVGLVVYGIYLSQSATAAAASVQRGLEVEVAKTTEFRGNTAEKLESIRGQIEDLRGRIASMATVDKQNQLMQLMNQILEHEQRQTKDLEQKK
jgi:TolA-binding protein